MKLTVFGATGGIGQEIVRQGLAAGHEVTAVVRDPARFPVTGARLDVFRSDLSDPESLREAVAGRDVVLSGLGARTRADAGVAARLTRSVLRAMEGAGTRRLLVVSAAPIGPVPPGQTVLDRAVLPIINGLYKHVYADLREMEAELAASATDWTSVRPPKLTNKRLTGRYRKAVGGNPSRGRMIGRADVAHAMLAMVDDPATVKQGVGVAY
ncbi:NAD(P)-dependent oxidoreductase [Streptomyces sp. NPDC127092]|uniref:NAD(P)-dependent oxidoreductase n=1 Tax=Streptomyces sp. NPDC127092 TaxID=3347135 RepID=UPI003652616B